MIRTDAVCNECNNIEEINHNYGKPNDWFAVDIGMNDSDKKGLHFCSKDCFGKYISKFNID